MIHNRRAFLLGASTGMAALGNGLFAGRALASPVENDGFILGTGPEGRCDETKVGGPFVMCDEDTQTWRMYYYCRDSFFPEKVAPAFGTGSIAMATSGDGIHWDRYDGAATRGALFTASSDANAFDHTHVGLGNIIRNEGQWIMSYFGGDTSIPTELGGHPIAEGYQYKGYRCRPGIAVSDDGLSWRRIIGNGPGGAAVDIGDAIYGAFPSIVFTGEEYLLYYTSLSPKYIYWDTRIFSSTDLVNWTDRGSLNWERGALAWQSGGMVTRNVQRNPFPGGRKWMMSFAALDAYYPRYIRRIGIAESDDGINWTQTYDDPIFFPGEVNRWDGGGTAYPQIIKVGDNYHLYYYGFAHRNNKTTLQRGIGLAISNGDDMRSFQRVKA